VELLLLLGCIVVAGVVTRHKWLNEPAKRREVLALQRIVPDLRRLRRRGWRPGESGAVRPSRGTGRGTDL